MNKIYLPKQRIKIEDVIVTVCNEYGFTPDEMVGQRGSPALAFARHVAMYIAYETCNKSLQEIGIEFGKRHHTAVIHAKSRIQGLIKKPKFETDKDKSHRIALIKVLSKILQTLEAHEPNDRNTNNDVSA